MGQTEIFALVKNIIEKHTTLREGTAIELSSCLEDDLKIDSMERLVVVMEIEKQLGIQLHDDHVYEKMTVQNLVDGVYAAVN